MLPAIPWLEARLATLAAEAANGTRVVVVFDLDNTLCDTRPRTLAAAEAFDASAQSAWFRELTLECVQRDGRATARHAARPTAPDPIVQAFATYWDEAFWHPASLSLDLAIPSVMHWALAAQARGIEVRGLTGRIAELHAESVRALARLGLVLPPEAVTCKPSLAVRTAPWKCEVLAQWQAEAPIGWFITEGRRDLAAVQAAFGDRLGGVLVDCSFESHAHPIAPTTPVLPRIF